MASVFQCIAGSAATSFASAGAGRTVATVNRLRFNFFSAIIKLRRITMEHDAIAAPAKHTPYQLEVVQTTQACKVLLNHISAQRKRRDAEKAKPDLLSRKDAEDDDEEPDDDHEPVWLILTTKKHIVDQKRLKPGKISLPHPIVSPTSSICLVTADPQSTYTTLVASPTFPAHLRTRITKITSLTSLKKNQSTFETRRALLHSHDIFLADDRIVTHLPSVLGKVFYKGGAKRPVPVDIKEPRVGEDGKRTKLDPATAKKSKDKIDGGRGAKSPAAVGMEVEKALQSALVHLAPGTSTAVKVARANMTAGEVCENVSAVVEGLMTRYVTKGWRNVRAIHVKGANTMAFPVWLADELWVDADDVLEKKKVFGKKREALATLASAEKADGAGEDAINKKRKADDVQKPKEAKHVKKKRKVQLDEKMALERASRKEALRRQKDTVMAEVS